MQVEQAMARQRGVGVGGWVGGWVGGCVWGGGGGGRGGLGHTSRIVPLAWGYLGLGLGARFGPDARRGRPAAALWAQQRRAA